MVYDTAFSPFGEVYNSFGTVKPDFTGDLQDIFPGAFDTPNRELAINGSRWLSPDPAGIAASELSNPQTWNRYAYVGNNPLTTIDPLGLDPNNNVNKIKDALAHRNCPERSIGYLEHPCTSPTDLDQLHCILDGIDVPCSLAAFMEKVGIASVCPDNDCKNPPVGPDWVDPGRGDPELRAQGAKINRVTDMYWVPGTGLFMRMPPGTVFVISPTSPYPMDTLIIPKKAAPLPTIGVPNTLTQNQINAVCMVYAYTNNNGFDENSNPTAWNATGVIFSHNKTQLGSQAINPEAEVANGFNYLVAPEVFMNGDYHACGGKGYIP